MISKRQLEMLYWQRRKTLNAIGKQHGVSGTAVWKWMRHHGLTRRTVSQAMFIRHNPTPPFRLGSLSPEQEFLRCVATVLYWCEGTHRDKRGKPLYTLTFTNADEQALAVWVRFLRDVCRLREDKIRARLYLHRDQSARMLLRYWSSRLRIPRQQFEQVTVTASSREKSKRNHPEYRGTVKIKVHSKALVDQVGQWVREIQDRVLWRGTQVVDGAALEKR